MLGEIQAIRCMEAQSLLVLMMLERLYAWRYFREIEGLEEEGPLWELWLLQGAFSNVRF